MSHSETGMTLASTLVALLLSAIVGLTFATLMKDMFFGIQRVTNQGEVQSVVRLVTAVLTNPDTCRFALREGAPGAHTPMTLPNDVNAPLVEKNIDLIISRRNSTEEGQIVIGRNNPQNQLNRVLTVNNILFRERSTEARRLIETLNPDGSTRPRMRTFVGDVVLQFGSADLVAGGGFAERTIPVCLGTDPATRQVQFCCDSTSSIKLCEDLGGFADADGDCVVGLNGSGAGFNCNDAERAAQGNPACVAPPAGCTRVYYINGLDTNLRPRCVCRVVCNNSA